MSSMNSSSTGIALITGASSGIGASFARRLAALLAGLERYRHLPAFDEVWLLARREDRLNALRDELSSVAPSLKIRLVVSDICAIGAVSALEEQLRSSGKPLNLLINNAGYGIYGPMLEAPLEKQLGEIDLNCRALTELCGRLGPLMPAGSLLLNVASLAAFAPLGNFAVYAATKAYVLSLSAALKAEWAHLGIRVHCLCPGPVSTEFSLVASGGARKEVRHGYSADKTTCSCLRAASRGAWLSFGRLSWQLQRLASAFFGPRVSAELTWRYMKRPQSETE